MVAHRSLLALCLGALPLVHVNAHGDEPRKEPTGIVNLPFAVDGQRRTAAIYVPPSYAKANAWPLIVFLHGGGGNGDNGDDALSWGRRSPIARAIEKHPEWFPALVLIPRCPRGKIWAPGPTDPIQSPWRLKKHGRKPVPDAADHITSAIDEVIARYSVDEDRITIVGHSMGGEGTTLYAARHADRIAGIAPSAGSAIIVPENAPILAQMGVWIFQGENDRISTSGLARQMAEAIRKAGGDVRYTELTGVGHASLGPMFEDDRVIKWLLSQNKSR